MKQFLFSLFTILLCSSLFAQREATWTLDLKGNSQDIVFHKATGTAIVVTEQEYVGIDPAAKNSKWTVKRSGAAKLSGVMAMESDYYEIPMSELAIINNNLVNVANGTIIIDKEKEGIGNVVNFHFLPASRQLLVETVSSGENVLYAVNLLDNTVDWKTPIGSAGLGEKLNVKDSNAPAYPVENFLPATTSKGQLIFRNGKELAVLDAKSGKLLWTEKCKPTDYVLDDKTNTIFIIEKGGGMVANAMGGGEARGNVVYAFDMSSGKSPWKKELKLDGDVRYLEIWGDRLLVVHQEGMNFYNISDGKSVWKNDFKEKRIADVAETGEGLQVIFKASRIQMLDASTGKKLWKKHQTLELEEEMDEDMEIDKSNEVDVDDFALYPSSHNSYTWIYFKKQKKWRSVNGNIIAVDRDRDQLVAIIPRGVAIVNTKDAKAKQIKLKLANKKPLTQIKIVPGNGYFVYGLNDYAMIGFDGKLKREKAFKIPGETGRVLLNAAAGLGSAAGAAAMITGAGTATAGVLGDSFTNDPKFAQMTSKGSNAMKTGAYTNEVLSEVYIERFKAFKEDESYAYFFSKNDAGDKVLYKVSKVNGEIEDEMKFFDNSPNYKIDELTSAVYYAHKNKLYVFE